MLFKEWEILLVDDEPDVLTISKLAMRNFKVYGLPIRIYTARSKADAIDFLHNKPASLWGISVAFIDVVMESDTAGLELCRYIRQDLNNQRTQLIVRTGQPGMAPERSVIDNYDVNGYFTKVDTTEDKLYSLVKSSVRQFVWTSMYEGSVGLLEEVIDSNDSQEKLRKKVGSAIERFIARDEAGRNRNLPGFMSVGGQTLMNFAIEEVEANSRIETLKGQDVISLNSSGDFYIRDDNNNQLIHVAGSDSIAEVNFLFQTPFLPPLYLIKLTHRVFKSVGAIWYMTQ